MLSRRHRTKLHTGGGGVIRKVEGVGEKCEGSAGPGGVGNLKSDLPGVLSDLNEKARVTVQSNRRLTALFSLEKLLSSLVSEYHETPTAKEVESRLDSLGPSIVYPSVAEMLHLVKTESRKHQTRESFEHHFANKVTWLIEQLSGEGERADIAEEKCAKLSECLVAREHARLVSLRKLKGLQAEVNQRTKHYRKYEIDKQAEIQELQQTVKILRERSAKARASRFHLITRPSVDNFNEKRYSAPSPVSRMLDRGGRGVFEEPSADEAELKKLRMMLDEVKSQEAARQEKEATVQRALAAIEKEQDRRKTLEMHWTKIFDSHDDTELSRAALQRAAKLCSQKDVESGALRLEVTSLSEALTGLKSIHAQQLDVLEDRRTATREDGEKTLIVTKRQLTAANLKIRKLEKTLSREIEMHKATRDRLTAMHTVSVASPKGSAGGFNAAGDTQPQLSLPNVAKRKTTRRKSQRSASPSAARLPEPVAPEPPAPKQSLHASTQTTSFRGKWGPETHKEMLETFLSDAQQEIDKLREIKAGTGWWWQLYITKCEEAAHAQSLLRELMLKWDREVGVVSVKGDEQVAEELRVVAQQKKMLDSRVRSLEKVTEAVRGAYARLRSLALTLLRQEADLEMDFTCLNCLDALENPQVCHPCGHTLCAACLSVDDPDPFADSAIPPDRRCPECFSEITHATSSTFIDSTLLRAKAHRGLLESIQAAIDES